jgi:hypothetical protein
MAILIARYICLVFISPPSELTIMVYFMMVMEDYAWQQILMILRNAMLWNQTKLLQGVSLQVTYPIPIPHTGIARLPRQSHG